ncbi:unnamed protein product [Gongylonema pulchrum]|uniref:Uncharacterized protein n=1 Tax=Gongylonema pulchrum TaxID=637853 RepID=A0A183EKL2_9BILA|nr:unnamed protein product [Gongylonema pulchrum]
MASGTARFYSCFEGYLASYRTVSFSFSPKSLGSSLQSFTSACAIAFPYIALRFVTIIGCRPATASAYYHLDDAVFLLKPVATTSGEDNLTDTWHLTGPYHLVSALNLLDRHYNPSLLLAQLHSLTLRSNSLLLLAVVLPLHQYVEFHPAKRTNMPDTKILLRGKTFEEQACSLVSDVLEPAGFLLLRWGKLPYLCEGDFRRNRRKT